MKLIIDILFSLGSIGFLIAAIKQLHKLIKVCKTDGISKTHYIIKIISLMCYASGYILGVLPMSLCIVTIELLLTIGIILLIQKYRGKSNMVKECKYRHGDWCHHPKLCLESQEKCNYYMSPMNINDCPYYEQKLR